MKKREFEYQKYVLRLVTIVPLLAVMYAIYMLFHVGEDSGIIIMVLLVLLNIIVLVAYYRLTEKVPFFKGTGYYNLDESNIIHLYIGKKEYILDHVVEIFAYESSLFGSMMYCLQIKNEKKKINIYSLPIKKDARFMECSTYHLFKYIISNNKNLKNVKNKSGTFNSEWYKVK